MYAAHFLADFHRKNFVLRLTNTNGFDYMLGVFLPKSSGHRGTSVVIIKIFCPKKWHF
jgi:hypothetical protein